MFDDLTDAELHNRLWELESDIAEITEQLRICREESRQSDHPEVRAWVFKATHARKCRRAEITQVKAELTQRRHQRVAARRQAHVQTHLNARFFKLARQRLPHAVFAELLALAEADTRRTLDANGAPVRAA